MKFVFVVLAAALVALSIATEIVSLTQEQLEKLASLNYDDLPQEIKDLITQSRAGDNSHWCCTNDQPVNIVQRTRVGKDVHTVATKIKTGYTSCGFNGWSMCSIYSTQYKSVVFYHIETYEVPDESACPDHHVKCCRDHIEIAGNCLALTTVSTNLDLLSTLLQLGLINGK